LLSIVIRSAVVTIRETPLFGTGPPSLTLEANRTQAKFCTKRNPTTTHAAASPYSACDEKFSALRTHAMSPSLSPTAAALRLQKKGWGSTPNDRPHQIHRRGRRTRCRRQRGERADPAGACHLNHQGRRHRQRLHLPLWRPSVDVRGDAGRRDRDRPDLLPASS